MKGGGWQRGAAEGKGTSDRCQAERMGHSFRVGAGGGGRGGGRGGGEEPEGSPNDATPNLSVPICVSQRGSPKVAGLYVPDRGARSEEGQEETAERGARKPCALLLLGRSAQRNDPQDGAEQRSRPRWARRSGRSHRRAPASRGKGASEAKRKKNKFLRLGVIFFSFGAQYKEHLDFVRIFLLLLN